MLCGGRLRGIVGVWVVSFADFGRYDGDGVVDDVCCLFFDVVYLILTIVFGFGIKICNVFVALVRVVE